jgi:hypothetical protein
MSSFTIEIYVTQEPGMPDTYRIEAPGIGLPALHDIFRKLADDLLVRTAVDRTVQALSEMQRQVVLAQPGAVPKP